MNLPWSGVVKFIGRNDSIKKLHTHLVDKERNAITAIVGMGGVGKTELALQYALSQFNQGYYYSAGFCWLSARGQDLVSQIINFAQVHLLLEIPDLETKSKIEFCWRYWPKGEALIVIDDVTDIDRIEPYLPPPDPRFNVLITTRVDFGKSYKNLFIEQLDSSDSIFLLENIIGKTRIQDQLGDAKKLCDFLGYLPLGLELCGRHLNNSPDLLVRDFLDGLKKQKFTSKALSTRESGMTAYRGVSAALELSWIELSEVEKSLIFFLSTLALTPIPWNFVEECLSGLDLNKSEVEDIRDNRLVRRSLLKRLAPNTYQMHQLTHEFIQGKKNAKDDYIEKNLSRKICAVVSSDRYRLLRNAPKDRVSKLTIYMPHINAIFVRYPEYFEEKKFLEIFESLLYFYELQGLYERVKKWSLRIQLDSKRLFSSRSLVYARTLFHLGRIQNIQSEYDEAEKNLDSSLKILSELNYELSVEYADNLDELGELYRECSSYEKAFPKFNEAISVRRKLAHKYPLYLAGSLSKLAALYIAVDSYEEVKRLVEECKQIFESNNEATDTSLILLKADIYNRLGNISIQEENYKKAEKLFLEEFRLRKKHSGMGNLKTLMVYETLAAVYQLQGINDKKIEKMYFKSLEGFQFLVTEKSEYYIICLNGLSRFYSSVQRYDDALLQINKAISLLSKSSMELKPLLLETQDDILHLKSLK